LAFSRFFQSGGGLTIIARRNASRGANGHFNSERFCLGFCFIIDLLLLDMSKYVKFFLQKNANGTITVVKTSKKCERLTFSKKIWRLLIAGLMPQIESGK
jgi:hypothetical protein